MLKSRTRFNKWMLIGIILIITVIWTPSQDNQLSYLSQKLMLENNLRERITEALDKLLDDIKFVVDVVVELEFQAAKDTEMAIGETAQTQVKTAPAEAEEQRPVRPSSDLGLPLPGFETPEEIVRAEQEAATATLREGPPEEVTRESAQTPTKKSAKTTRSTGPAIPVIKRQQVNIIMEDGVTPEIIENVRQVVAVASHYDRSRGDVISVMTASFKKREDQDAAEAIILKNIAEKIDNLERRQQEAERLSQIEQQKQLERQAVIRDSLRIQELRRQISDLKNQLESPQISDDQRQQTRALADARETELYNLKEQLRESNRRLQELEMGALETTPPGFAKMDNRVFYIILGLFAVALIVLVIILLVNRRNHQKRQELEWGYGTKVPMGPRPSQTTPTQPTQPVQPSTPAAPPEQAPPSAPAAETPKQEASYDIGAAKEEMKGIKQSVISMSVGQPETASRVINEWLSQQKQAEESESEF
ncbi:MAG: flagellar M-ring protein FliF C-terminal domain-containing protein [Fidelibacterota bacterium]